ncbi:hypothetical protein D3C81_1782060 [compost metagenome]
MRQHLGEHKGPHEGADNRTDHIRHEKNGAEEAFGSGFRLNEHGKHKCEYILQDNHEQHIFQGEQQRMHEIRVLAQRFDEVAKSDKGIIAVQAVPVREAVVHAADRRNQQK